MNHHSFHKVISGQDSCLAAKLLRPFLGCASLAYETIIRLRNLSYLKGWLKTYHAGVPVISVGNITTGGTGKTPLVIWLCNFLQQKNIHCAILTRGYKTTQNSKLKTQNLVDEPAILTESCRQACVVVNPDRVAGASEAVNKHAAKVLVMDDGFQHQRLRRDLDIVTIDATLPFGYGKILPAGLLREPVDTLKRAKAVVITRCDQIDETKLTELENKLQSVNRQMVIAKSIHAPVCAKSLQDKTLNINQLKNKKVFAFCGIGNPHPFFDTVKRLEMDLVGSKIYNDHYHYTENDIADIYAQADYLKADLILTTQKDWTKTSLLAPTQIDIVFAYLAIEIKFVDGEDKLKRLIEDTLAGKIS